MTDKNEDKQHKELMTALEKVQAPLEAIVLLKLADEFYTKEERTRLYAEYKKLVDADKAAYEVLSQTTSNGDRDAKMAAFEAKKATSDAEMAFRKEHRLVIRLMEARDKFSKSRYE
ncbi:hypothetical protein LL999_12350 [Burkholderia ambifaria]|uniref:hypothetical protein n=1 Tax=Burkholderia ambifaria TaxID=152480 RepID=UPI001E37B36E|nr:hypothetical protein [Burkholderia ambifaria]UEP20721.1 hypothetical protein LL999_12350 [Burkholderia ambifaria]